MKKLSREPPDACGNNTDNFPFPDPWETPRSDDRANLPTAHPSIGVVETTEILRLPSAKSNPLQIILQDWLKMGDERTQKLASQIKDALTLLCWMQMKTQLIL